MERFQDMTAFMEMKSGMAVRLKVVAGYDGVKDKTREMAARGRLLQYDALGSSKNDILHIFITDGEWSTDLQKLLLLSGWDYIVPIFSLDNFLSRTLPEITRR